ncbi:hypothetical protein [Microbulbifer aggregans]|uniref:hypothetical protein n=1 Tax=Microbulbifer aggregans TaxID=1769779 RepID=UPI001CFDB669|nr:hypothetical protein [Microbulbifer aggregans]
MDASTAKQTFRRGNLKSVVVAPSENSEKWILRIIHSNGYEETLSGARKRREFVRIQTALKVAREIGFDRAEVALS